MEIRNVMGVAALVAAGLAVQGLILAEVVAKPLATAVATAQREQAAARAAEGAAEPPALAKDAEPSELSRVDPGAEPDGVAGKAEGYEEADAGGSAVGSRPIATVRR